MKSPSPNEEQHPERFMSHPAVAGIDVGIQYVCRAARARKPREREAMMWLARYASLLDVTADSLAGKLGMDAREIRLALTWPEQDLARFVRAVESLRAEFEAPLLGSGPAAKEANPFHPRSPWHDAYGHPAETLVFKRTRSAVKMAAGGPEIVEINGAERLGKTTAMRHFFLLNLHRAAWIEAPRGRTEQDFLRAVASGMGVGNGTYYKGPQLRHKIENSIGADKIEILFIDSAHRLLPNDLTKCPDKLEELMRWRDHFGVSILGSVTPQFANAVQQMVALADAGQSRYKPGQWIGRRQPFDMPDTLSDGDLELIARWHAPGVEECGVAQLIGIAKASPGYIGTMVKTIRRAAARAEANPYGAESIERAHKQVAREERLLALAQTKVVAPFARNQRRAA